MNLIIGGAYQGKRDFARDTLNIPEREMFTCTEETIDFSKACIDRLEDYVLACVQKGIDPLEQLKARDLEDKTIICMDMFCGVVPIDAQMRLWRHSTGLVCQYLSKRADRVYRIVCGLEQRLK